MDIRALRAEFQARSGGPRAHAELAGRGHGGRVSAGAGLMRGPDIRARTARTLRRTTDAGHDRPAADHLLDRQRDRAGPPEAWVADRTGVPPRAGGPYLAAGAGLSARRAVGWSPAGPLGSRRVVDARARAAGRRRPGEGRRAPSDRGGPYAGAHYQLLRGGHGITRGMSRRAAGWDNAPPGSCFASLTEELVHGAACATRAEARAAVVEYIAVFCNPQRRHASLG